MPSTKNTPVRAKNSSGESGEAVYFQGIQKTYPDGTVAVENLDLKCPGGLITVFVGPSGCGKTTSLRMINRMVKPTGGKIWLGDNDVSHWDETQLRLNMGYVIQSGGLFPHRTIVDNIATVPVLLGEKRKNARKAALQLMKRVGLEPHLGSRYPYQLSGGQQQRVGVARALAADPPVLLMDEPFSAVDPLVRGELQLELLRLQEELAKTIIFVTHDIDEAVLLGDQIAVFEPGGRLAQVAAPEVLLSQPESEYVRNFIGADSGVKWLSLISASSLPLRKPATTPLPADTASDQWRLAIDDNERPLGWIKPGVTATEATDLLPHRQTFHQDTDTMRVALNAALLSPCAQAIATNHDGQVVGIISHDDLTRAIRDIQESANA